jgi:hypothetical protein
MAYNGWSNYETWAVKLWLDNDEGSYTYMQERSGEVLAEHTEEGKTDDDAFKSEFAEFLKNHHEEARDELNIPTSVFTDLIGAALSEVDWYEIAGAYLDEAKEAAE